MNQRKALFLVAVIIMSLSLFSCQNSAVSNDKAVVSNNNIIASNNNTSQPNETEKVLLEIYTDVQGMATPKGKYLDLRVYDSSRAECEYYPQTEKKQFDEQVQLEKKSFYLDKEEFEQMRNLLNDPVLLKSKDKYEPVLLTDVFITQTITIYRDDGKRKEIVIEGIVTLDEDEKDFFVRKQKGVYPKQLLDLLRLSDRIRQSRIRGN